jgi:RNA polymerase-binding transcription factor DksA
MDADAERIRAALLAVQRETVEGRQRLDADLRSVLDASTDVATDDEHDPEGATIAYERSRLTALIDQADDHLAEVHAALGRLAAGTYGRCERCGGQIPVDRLEAVPAARTCRECATQRR